MLKNKRILFLGAGSMAEAIISGIIENSNISSTNITVSNHSNKQRLERLKSAYGIQAFPKEQLHIAQADIIILAMKPKDVEKALYSIRQTLQPHQLILSVIAGVTISFIEQQTANGQQIIRVMPNTSSMIGESATAISSGNHTTGQNLVIAKELLQCIGKVYVIDEQHMDIFTGIAGSGPAYLYYLMEHMEKAGIQAGLPQHITREIVSQTFLGASKMVQKDGEDPSALRKKVTSPNGTTAAGLQALEKYGGAIAITKAIQEASQRSQEISEERQKSTV